MGVLTSEVGDLPPVDPGAFTDQTGMEDPQEDHLAVHCFCVCVVGVHCWEISLG